MSTGELKVSLVDASGLKGADFVGGDPVWNETFAFPVSSSPVDDPIQNKLILRIMDADAYTDDDFIGQAT
ncbi:hypothetical protein MUK42_32942 [Musa troglodytarum]|uniref:C2 domain-containing protein n=1 Tax=Musa troglodytarum TaxID=320322 RepID=A0A9E7GEF9_9LILI|nr:hypothetical protein MUK42_32942 [Musa troglodytarum]